MWQLYSRTAYLPFLFFPSKSLNATPVTSVHSTEEHIQHIALTSLNQLLIYSIQHFSSSALLSTLALPQFLLCSASALASHIVRYSTTLKESTKILPSSHIFQKSHLSGDKRSQSKKAAANTSLM